MDKPNMYWAFGADIVQAGTWLIGRSLKFAPINWLNSTVKKEVLEKGTQMTIRNKFVPIYPLSVRNIDEIVVAYRVTGAYDYENS